MLYEIYKIGLTYGVRTLSLDLLCFSVFTCMSGWLFKWRHTGNIDLKWLWILLWVLEIIMEEQKAATSQVA